MNIPATEIPTTKLRLLVVMACYGTKNLPFLKKIINQYQSMTTVDVDVVVVSEAKKDLPDGIEVIVGLPTKNPWTLPFAHKAVLANNLSRYDLFIYTEDDMNVTESNIQAFLRVSPLLQPDEIAGYLRYETDAKGTKILTDVHGSFHWKPESVQRRGPHVVAEFNNEHAGFYILTRRQLQQAIDSGGFLKAPYEGRYGLPETAATDPYTCCGFKKLIVISEFDNFLIQHMSNLYVDRHGVSLPDFEAQIQVLMAISQGQHPATKLCPNEPLVLQRDYSKSYYEPPDETLMRLVPAEAKTVLTLGCGTGDTEVALQKRGMESTALPLDSVIGMLAARRGIEMVYGALDEGLGKLAGRKFDCILISNLLHLLPEPAQLIDRCSQLLARGGALIMTGPNFENVPTQLKILIGRGDYPKLRNFNQSGITRCSARQLAKYCQTANLRVTAVRWQNHSLPGKKLGALRLRLGVWTAKSWILVARR